MDYVKTEIFLFGAFLLLGGYLIYLGTIGKDRVVRQINFASAVESLNLSGISANKRYKRIRNILFALFAFLSIYKMSIAFTNGLILLLLSVALYFLSAPKDYFGKKETPYKKCKDLFIKKRRERLKQELIGITIQLKNLLLSAAGEKSFSTTYVLNRLLPYTKSTKKYFVDLTILHSVGEKDKAISLFENAFGTKQAADFVNILLKLDELPAQDFLPQIDLLLDGFWEERESYYDNKTKTQGQMLFLFASVPIALLIADFIFITVQVVLAPLTQLM